MYDIDREHVGGAYSHSPQLYCIHRHYTLLRLRDGTVDQDCALNCKKRTDACHRPQHEKEAPWLRETGEVLCWSVDHDIYGTVIQQSRLTSDSREHRQVEETTSAETAVACWTEPVLDYY